MNDDRLVLHIPKRNLSGEDFHSEHCEREDISGFGRRNGFGTGFFGWVDDFWSEPSRGSCDSRCCRNREDWVRDDGTEAIIAHLGRSGLGYHHVGLDKFRHQYGPGLRRRATHSFQIPVNNFERVEILKSFGNLQQLEVLIRHGTRPKWREHVPALASRRQGETRGIA